MAFQREQYKKYLEINGHANSSPYCSCLDKIEKMLQADIDREYDADKCERLLKTLLDLRGNPADDAKKYGQIKNLMSKLNKYCQFRNDPGQLRGVKNEEKEEKPAAESQMKPMPDESEETFFFNTNRMTIPMEECIQQCRSYEQFEARYLKQFLQNDDRVGQYIDELLWKYDKDKATVSTMALLDRSYVGNIVRGINNAPSRDALISICLAIGTTVDEVQHLLRYAGHAPLYVRRQRDVIIWFGFMKHRSAVQVGIDLENHGLSKLTSKKILQEENIQEKHIQEKNIHE